MTSEFAVSAVIPTYNRADYLPQAIDSVLGQTHPVREVIVVDDGSTDDTGRVVASYGNRVRYIRRENGGEAAGRNTGVQAATQEWVAFLDSDDMWLPQKIEAQAAALSAYPESGLCYCEDGQPDSNSRFEGSPRIVPPRPKESMYRLLLDRSLVGISTVMVRRELMLAVAPFDTTLHWGVDWELLARLARITEFVEVDETLVYYRLHAGSITANLDVRVRYGVEAVRKIYSDPAAARFRSRLPQKVSEIIADAGTDLYYSGAHSAARRLLLQAVAACPGNTHAWSYLAKTLIPASVAQFGRSRRRVLSAGR
jgi:glycosyltransferase involved in cell wall biosynthesis